MNVFKIAAMISVFIFSNVGFAQNNETTVSTTADTEWKKDFPKPHMGLLAGVVDPESYDAAAEYGVDVGYQPYVPFGLGLEVTSSTNSIDNQADMTRTKFMVKGSYNFGGSTPVIRESYVGLGAGPMLESFGSDTDVAVGFMPYAGFDVPLQKKSQDYMSLGLVARYLTTTSGGPDSFALNGALKYWF